MHRTRLLRAVQGSRPAGASLLGPREGCESGRIGTLGKRVWGNPPWVRIPPPPRLPRPRTLRRVSARGLDLDGIMGIALAEAAAAAAEGEVPVGAVVVGPDGSVVARRHNERERRHDPLAHAELLALADAAAALGEWRLTETTLVVTLEPCLMCAGAMLAARVPHLVYGAVDLKAGAVGSLYNVATDPRLNHEIAVTIGVRADECGEVLSSFFSAKRGK